MYNKILPPVSYISTNEMFPLRTFPVDGKLAMAKYAETTLVEVDITVSPPPAIEGKSIVLLIVQDKIGHKVKLSEDFIVLSGTIKEIPLATTLLSGIWLDGKVYCYLWSKV